MFSFIVIVILRNFLDRCADDMETNRKTQIIFAGILYPILIFTELLGFYEWDHNDIITCENSYDAFIFYQAMIFTCALYLFMTFLILLCVLMPIWCRDYSTYKRNRRNPENRE